MDRMLHRGEYAAIKALVGETPPVSRTRVWLGRLGLNEDFTLGDKWILGGLIGWSLLWFLVLIVGTIANLIHPWPIQVWSVFWEIVGLGLPILLAVITGIWFIWGGVLDMRKFFRRLQEQKINHLDDGTVVGHQNLDESVQTDPSHPSSH